MKIVGDLQQMAGRAGDQALGLIKCGEITANLGDDVAAVFLIVFKHVIFSIQNSEMQAALYRVAFYQFPIVA